MDKILLIVVKTPRQRKTLSGFLNNKSKLFFLYGQKILKTFWENKPLMFTFLMAEDVVMDSKYHW